MCRENSISCENIELRNYITIPQNISINIPDLIDDNNKTSPMLILSLYARAIRCMHNTSLEKNTCAALQTNKAIKNILK